MLNLATVSPKLDFLHDLIGRRDQQYRHAFWLKSNFEDIVWECHFDGTHTKHIDFNIAFPDGTRLIEAKHAVLLDTIKCFLCVQTHVDTTKGKKLNINSAYDRLGFAIKLIDYLLLHADNYPIHQHGLESLSSGELSAILLDIGSHANAYQGIYQWPQRLSQFLKTHIHSTELCILEDTLASLPKLQNNDIPVSAWKLTLTPTELALARAWLYLNNFYHLIKGPNIFNHTPNHRKLAAIIYANTLGGKQTNLPQLPELGYQIKTYTKREYQSAAVMQNKNSDHMLENTFLAYCNALQHLGLLNKLKLPVPVEALMALKQKKLINHLELLPLGRFRTLPSQVVFSSLRKALEFAMSYGDELVDSYLSAVKAAHQHGKTLRQWQQLSVDIKPYLTPLVRNMGVQRWFVHECDGNLPLASHNSIYYAKMRAHEGLWNLLLVLYGAIQLIIGTLMARRHSELATLMPTKCLDMNRRHLIFFVCKTGYDNKREKIARPIPIVAARLIVLLERLQTGLLEAGLIDNYHVLFAYPKPYGSGLIKRNWMQFNYAMDTFCDYIETPLNQDGQRFYIRQHQLRRFFAMLFFWGSSFGGMDTLRWFLAHTDVEHLYHYITESMPGEVLRGVQSNYVIERLKTYDHDVEQLADLLEQHFSTRKFDLLNTDELDAYVEDLIKEGQVIVEPEFFKDGTGKEYRILIKVKERHHVKKFDSSIG